MVEVPNVSVDMLKISAAQETVSTQFRRTGEWRGKLSENLFKPIVGSFLGDNDVVDVAFA